MWGGGGSISTGIRDSLEDCGERGGRHSDAGPRVPVPLVPPHQDRRLPGPGVTRASGLGDRRGPVPPVAVAVSGRRCVDQAGGRCVGGGVPRGGQRAHAGKGRPRRLGQETALRPAPLSVPGAGRAAGPVWLRLRRFPRCGCQGSGLFPSQPAPHRRGAQQSSSSPGSSPSSASVCGSLRHLRGKQVPRAGSRPPFPRGCRSLAVLARLPRWPQGYRGADGLALSLVSGHTRGFCQDCDGALRCPQEPFATPSPRDFLICRAFLSGDAAGLRRAACTATKALRGAHSSWFYGRRVYWVSRRAELASLR